MMSETGKGMSRQDYSRRNFIKTAALSVGATLVSGRPTRGPLSYRRQVLYRPRQ